MPSLLLNISPKIPTIFSIEGGLNKVSSIYCTTILAIPYIAIICIKYSYSYYMYKSYIMYIYNCYRCEI